MAAAAARSGEGVTRASAAGATLQSVASGGTLGGLNDTQGSLGKQAPDAVSLKALHKFLFPAHLEHPESTGRLDLFAYYGPVTEQGELRGGLGGEITGKPTGQHVHTDLEIRHMIKELNREHLYKILARPRATVETIVHELLPKAVAHHYTTADITKMFKDLHTDDQGCMRFSEMQDIVLADQRRRLNTLIAGGEIQKTARRAIPYQTRPAQTLQAICNKKKLRQCEEVIVKTKRFNAYAMLVAPLEQQNLSSQLATNTQLTRGLGDVSDRWDRYCAVRRTGKTSYVNARNTERLGIAGDDTLADKAARSSTLTASSSLNGPLERRC